MTWVVLVGVTVMAALAQALLPGWAWLGQARFPFLLSAVLYYALHHEAGTALAAACLAGLLQDALSPLPLGYSILCFGAVGLAVNGFRRLVVAEALPTHLLFGSLAAAAATLALWVMLAAADLSVCPPRRALLKALGAAVLGLAAAPAVFAVAGRLDRLVGNLPEGEESENGRTSGPT